MPRRPATSPSGDDQPAVASGTLQEVTDQLGHSSAAAALRHQHVSAKRDAAIARVLDAMLDGEATRKRRNRSGTERVETDILNAKAGSQDPV